jgi:hypothetical protein
MCRQVPTAESALQSASALLRDAMRLALDDFTTTLKHHAAVPSAAAMPFGGAPSSIGGDSAMPSGQPLLPMLGNPGVGESAPLCHDLILHPLCLGFRECGFRV